MREFKFRISADVSDLEAQFKNGADALKQLALSASKAEDKLAHLKVVGSYIEQMDGALNELSVKYPDVFNKIFGNVDTQMKNALQPLMQMPKEITKLMMQAGNTLQSSLSGKNVPVEEFKEIANVMNAINQTIGGTKIDFSFLDEAGTSAEKANKMLDKLQGMMQTLAGTKGGSGANAVSSSINNISDASVKATANVKELQFEVKTLIKTAKANREELYSAQDIMGEIGNPKDAKTAGQYVVNLRNEFVNLSNSMAEVRAKFQNNGILSESDHQQLIKYIQLASKLRVVLGQITNGKINVGDMVKGVVANTVSSKAFPMQTLSFLEELDKRLKVTAQTEAQVAKVKNATAASGAAEASTKKESAAYQELNNQMAEYIRLKQESSKMDGYSDEYLAKTEQMENILSNIANKYKLSDTQTEALGDKLAQDSVQLKEAMSIMQQTLGAQFPVSVENVGNAINNVTTGVKTLEGSIDGVSGKSQNAEKELKDIGAAAEESGSKVDKLNQKINSGTKGGSKKVVTDTTGNVATGDTTNATKNVSGETASLEQLRAKVELVEQQVRAKTQAFVDEKTVVDANVSAEIQSLEILRAKIELIEQQIRGKTQAFLDEKNAVDISVGAEIAKLEELYKQLEKISNTVLNINKIDLGANVNSINQLFSQLSTKSTEYLGLFNSKTGQISSEYFEGTGNRAEGTFKNKSGYDTMFHNHPNVLSAEASAGDWQAFANEFEHFKQQIIVAKNEIARFDLSSLTREKMNEIVQAINSTLNSTKYDKQWFKDTETYGKDEATQRWIGRNTSSILDQYGVTKTVEPISNLLKGINNVTQQDIKIEGIDRLMASLDSLKQSVDNAASIVKASADAATARGTANADEVATTKAKAEAKAEINQANQALTSLNKMKNTLKDSSFKYLEKISNMDFVPQDSVDKVKQMQGLLNSLTNSADVDDWRRMWIELTAEIDRATVEQREFVLGNQGNKLNGLQNSLQTAYKSVGIDIQQATSEQLEFKASYDDLMQRIQAYAGRSRAISQEEIASIEAEVNALKQKAAVLAENANMQERQRKAYGSREVASASGKLDKIAGAAAQFQDSPVVEGQLTRVRAAYNELAAAQKNFAASGRELTESERQQFQTLVNNFEIEHKRLASIVNGSSSLAEKGLWNFNVDPSSITNTQSLTAAMKTAISSSVDGKIKFGKFNERVNEMSYSVKNANGQWDHFTAKLNYSRTAIVGLSSGLKATNGFLKETVSGFARAIKSASYYVTGYSMIYRLFYELKRGVTYVKEIDTALTELKKVTDETEESYSNFLQTASKTASAVGSTVKDITTMTADWARLGYTMEQAGKLAETTAILLNVSEFDDAEKASEALISTVQAFGYAADESMDVVNVLNEVGKELPVDNYIG